MQKSHALVGFLRGTDKVLRCFVRQTRNEWELTWHTSNIGEALERGAGFNALPRCFDDTVSTNVVEDRANSDAKPEEPDKLYDCQSYDQRSTDVSEDDATLPFDISADSMDSQQTFSSSSDNSMEIPLASSTLGDSKSERPTCTDDTDQRSHMQLQEENVAATTQMPGSTSQTLNPRSKERAVPASRLGRMWRFGGLAAGLTVGALAERTRKAVGRKSGDESSSTSSLFLSEQNMERIVDTLCRVRGAALKLGQMISIQDEAFVSPKVQRIFERVRNSADFMPIWQMERVLGDELGQDWNSKLREFDYRPIAAASIGQVHRGVLHDEREVAIKIQYPGVAESIDSDVNNLLSILSMAKIMPDGLFLEKAADVARKELAWETDYIREAESSEKFRILLSDDPSFVVPRVIPEVSSKRVITTEMVYGIPMDQVVQLDQQTKTEVAYLMLKLSLREVFEFQFMQTDPNWSNFFYNTETKKIALLDFGASRGYSKNFIDLYIKIIKAAADQDRATVIEVSKQIGFLTGYESKAMVDAHTDTIMILAEPFTTSKPYNFKKQDMTQRVHVLLPTMLEHRLTPPPDEIYSLHRKLSGAFLLCTKLGAEFACGPLLDHAWENYKFEEL